MVYGFQMVRTMKILGLLSSFFIIQVSCRPSYETLCDRCECSNNEHPGTSLEISGCFLSIEANFTSNSDRQTDLIDSVRFNDVKISYVGPDGFSIFPSLEHVEFISSDIVDMHTHAFDKNELSTLLFRNCKFLKPNTTFITKDLDELVITNSSLVNLPNFDGLPTLLNLHLDGNKLKTVDINAFNNLELLEEVRITNNEISSIPSRLFYHNVKLMALDLSHNLLSFYSLEGKLKLEYLSLAYNQLEVFNSTSSKNLKKLKSLDLSHNRIAAVDEKTFEYMPFLGVLNLSYNKLTNLENNTFSHNMNLEKLILDGNHFKILPVFMGATNLFQKLINFSCSKCDLVALSSYTFGSMPALMNITLKGNNLQSLDPRAFAMVTSLRIIDLSNNKLTNLGGNVFIDNKVLEEINLSGNPLKTLQPEDFIYLKNLRELDVSNASLKSLWADNYGYQLKKLEQLTISNNLIEDITANDLKVMPNLLFIDLENNPIRCTIQLVNLIKWLTEHKVYSSEGANLLRTNEKLLDDAELYSNHTSEHEIDETYNHRIYWQKLGESACVPSDENTVAVKKLINNEIKPIDDVPKVYPPQPTTPEDDDILDDDDIDDSEDDEDSVLDEIDDIRQLNAMNMNDQFSFSQPTYIISPTSVFIITALIVLLAAVSITLIILRRHNTLNINNANLPRIKIPRWETIPTQKKHSGSIYRPLSEEIISPPTPKINRYEFRTNPSVHGTQQ